MSHHEILYRVLFSISFTCSVRSASTIGHVKMKNKNIKRTRISPSLPPFDFSLFVFFIVVLFCHGSSALRQDLASFDPSLFPSLNPKGFVANSPSPLPSLRSLSSLSSLPSSLSPTPPLPSLSPAPPFPSNSGSEASLRINRLRSTTSGFQNTNSGVRGGEERTHAAASQSHVSTLGRKMGLPTTSALTNGGGDGGKGGGGGVNPIPPPLAPPDLGYSGFTSRKMIITRKHPSILRDHYFRDDGEDELDAGRGGDVDQDSGFETHDVREEDLGGVTERWGHSNSLNNVSLDAASNGSSSGALDHPLDGSKGESALLYEKGDLLHHHHEHQDEIGDAGEEETGGNGGSVEDTSSSSKVSDVERRARVHEEELEDIWAYLERKNNLLMQRREARERRAERGSEIQSEGQREGARRERGEEGGRRAVDGEKERGVGSRRAERRAEGKKVKAEEEEGRERREEEEKDRRENKEEEERKEEDEEKHREEEEEENKGRKRYEEQEDTQMEDTGKDRIREKNHENDVSSGKKMDSSSKKETKRIPHGYTIGRHPHHKGHSKRLDSDPSARVEEGEGVDEAEEDDRDEGERRIGQERTIVDHNSLRLPSSKSRDYPHSSFAHSSFAHSSHHDSSHPDSSHPHSPHHYPRHFLQDNGREGRGSNPDAHTQEADLLNQDVMEADIIKHRCGLHHMRKPDPEEMARAIVVQS